MPKNKQPVGDQIVLTVTFAADLPVGNAVKISAADTVDNAGAGEFAIGEVYAPRDANNKGSVRTYFGAEIECAAVGAVAAGGRVKLAAVSGGATRVTAMADNDPWYNFYGVAITGGTDTTIRVLAR